MEGTSQWLIALSIGLSIAVLPAWFTKLGSDFKDGFLQKQRRNINELSIIA